MPSRNLRQVPRRTALGKLRLWFGLGVIAVLALLLPRALFAETPIGTNGAPPITATRDGNKALADYAGSESCRTCHAEAYELWRGSNHGLAERAPQADFDRAAFDPSRSFQFGARQSGASMDGDNYVVTTPGLSRTNEAHRVVRVIGNDPLRQFLVAFPDGRLQALEAAWDPHRNQWFDVFGKEDRQPGEWGHWTGRGMNWNSMCAACHNTRLQKNYAEVTDSYHTTMAEKSVGCESCHGPLKAHVVWQNKFAKNGQKDATMPGFSRQRTMENCGFCHARRTDLTGDFKPGDSFFDQQSLAVVDQSDNYYPDGQVHGEDYEFGSFLGSKMQAKGVQCLDCHNPHSGKTLLPGNWLCIRCHNGSYTNAPVINPFEHSHHKVFGYDSKGTLVNSNLLDYKPHEIKETGGECVNCHMPETFYMQRHGRHDHGFTIPDPLLTQEHGIPNACNRCHTGKSAAWALAACTNWYGQKMERPTRQRAQSIAQARDGDPAARQPLLAMLTGNENPYWQAVAAGLLGQWADEDGVSNALLKCLEAPHPLVREQAVRALEPLAQQPGSAVTAALRKLADDPIRSVRISAAWSLRADLPADAPAMRELQHYLDINADQPTGQLQQGAYALARNQLPEALAHYQKAVLWDPNSAPLRHDLAIALSLLGRTSEAVKELEAACRLEPKEAEYEFKLGLAWNELGDLNKTAGALEKAVQLNPLHGRAWFNLGLARNARGQSDPALDALSHAEAALPNDPEIPYARATILLRLGRIQDAKRAANRALAIDPNYTEARKLIEDIPNTDR